MCKRKWHSQRGCKGPPHRPQWIGLAQSPLRHLPGCQTDSIASAYQMMCHCQHDKHSEEAVSPSTELLPTYLIRVRLTSAPVVSNAVLFQLLKRRVADRWPDAVKPAAGAVVGRDQSGSAGAQSDPVRAGGDRGTAQPHTCVGYAREVP